MSSRGDKNASLPISASGQQPFALLMLDAELHCAGGSCGLPGLFARPPERGLNLRELAGAGAGAAFAGRVESSCTASLGDGEPRRFADVVETPSGTLHIDTLISPVSGADGAPAIMLALYDTTALTAARDKAESASNRRGTLLESVCRELRVSMDSVTAMTELLDGTRLSDLQRGYVNNISGAADAMLRITGDLRDFMLMDVGRLELLPRVYSPLDMLGELAAVSAARAEQKGLALVTRIHPDIPSRLTGDDMRVKQIMLNLLYNAVKYTRRGHITLSARFEKEASELVLTVEDTGPGIHSDDMQHIFSAFTRADVQRGAAQGAGLGLAIGRSIALSMGGGITARSEPGRGSAFTVRLPQDVADPAPSAAVERAERMYVLNACEGPCGDALSLMLDDLGVCAEHMTDAAALSAAIKAGAYTHVFYRRSPGGHIVRRALPLLRDTRTVLVLDWNDDPPESDGGQSAAIYEPVLITDVARALAQPESAPEAQACAEQTELFEAHGARALVVDDNAINLIVAGSLLDRFAIAADTAESGAQALAMLTEADYDIVFMDHMMPDMDGIECAARIRAMGGRFARLPVIALTASDAPGARELFMQNGMNDFLCKPLDETQLARTLQRFLPPEKLSAPSAPEQSECQSGIISPDLRAVAASCPVDVRAALMQVGGSERTCLAVLTAFANTLESKLKRMDNLFAQQQWDNLRIEIHAHKSALFSVGAHALSARARALELALEKGGLDTVTAGLPALMDDLRALLQKLAAALPQPAQLADKPSATPERRALLGDALVSVTKMLDALEYDHALSRVSELRALSYGETTDRMLGALATAIETFDFDEAARLIAQAAQEGDDSHAV